MRVRGGLGFVIGVFVLLTLLTAQSENVQAQNESETPKTAMEAVLERTTNFNATGKGLECILEGEDVQEEIQCMRRVQEEARALQGQLEGLFD